MYRYKDITNSVLGAAWCLLGDNVLLFPVVVDQYYRLCHLDWGKNLSTSLSLSNNFFLGACYFPPDIVVRHSCLQGPVWVSAAQALG